MVTTEDSRVIDPEFAFYGPIGFDLGAFFANLLLSWYSQPGHADRCRRSQRLSRLGFWSRCESSGRRFTTGSWRSGEQRGEGDAFPKRMFGEPGDVPALARARADFMRTLFADMLGFGACKMIRRILGFAHVLDLDGIADTKMRARCETAALAMAMTLLKSPAQFRSIDDVIDAVRGWRDDWNAGDKMKIVASSMLPACLALACLTVMGGANAEDAAKPLYGAWGIDLTAMDPKVKPGDDFNRYASGAWLARTQIPADKPMASLRYEMTDRTEARLHDLLENGGGGGGCRAAGVAAGQGRTFSTSRSWMRGDSTPWARSPSSRSSRPFGRRTIAKTSRCSWAATTMSSTAPRSRWPPMRISKDVSRYAVYVSQAGLGLPDRDYYLKPGFAAQKAAYQQYVAQLLTLVHWSDPQASAAAVVALRRASRK